MDKTLTDAIFNFFNPSPPKKSSSPNQTRASLKLKINKIREEHSRNPQGHLLIFSTSFKLECIFILFLLPYPKISQLKY